MTADASPNAASSATEPPAIAYWGAAALLSALALIGTWAPTFPPGMDLPSHALFAAVTWAPQSFDGLMRTHFALTSQLFVTLIAPLTPLGAAFALKVGLTLVAALGAAALWGVGRALGDRRPAALLFGIAAAHGFSTAMGFANFALAVAMGALALALALRAWNGSGRWAWIALSAWTLIVAHAHVMAAGIIGLHIALLSFGVGGGPRWRRVALTVAALAPSGVFSLAVAWLARWRYVDVAAGLSTQRLPLGQQLRNIGEASFGGLSPLGLAVVAAVALTIALRFSSSRFGSRGAAALAAAAVALPAVIWLGVYLVVPYHGWGWAFAQPRVLVALVLLPAAWAAWGPHPRIALAALTLLLAAHLGFAAQESVRLGATIAAEVERFGDAPPGRTMEVVIDPGSARYNDDALPLLHAGKYAMLNGGASPSLPRFNPAIHGVEATAFEDGAPPYPPAFIARSIDCEPGPECVRAVVALQQRVAVQGLRFDTVLLVGAPPSWGEELVARGYERLAPALYRARPSALRVTLALDNAAATAPLIVRAGYPGGFGHFVGARRPPAPPLPNGERITLAPLPAGPIVVELVREPDGDAEGGDDPQEQVLARVEVDVVVGQPTEVRLTARSAAD